MPSGAEPGGGVLFSTVGRNAGLGEAAEAVAGMVVVFDVFAANVDATGFDLVRAHHAANVTLATSRTTTVHRAFNLRGAGCGRVTLTESFLLIAA